MENYKGGTMKKSAYLFSLLVYTILLQCCSASRKSEPVVSKTFVARNPGIEHGEVVFMENCNKCHPGGEAGLAPATNSNPAPTFIKKFQVRHGLGVMPSFKDNEISDSDLNDIAAYLKARKKFH
jgi:mono/diheme cytochrome c family protein